MLVSELLEHQRISLSPPGLDKWQAIEILVDLIPESADLPDDPKTWLETVIQREQLLSTGFEAGIAVPHGMLDGDFKARGALMIHDAGIEFEALDRAPAHFVLLMLFPDTDAGRKRHVELLGSAIRLFTDSSFRDEILASRDPAAALATLRRAEKRILS